MASEKDQVPAAEEATNGEKNGDAKEDAAQKLSLGEIAAIDEEIAKAKTEQLQLLHNLFYGKNGNGPQIKRNIRKFAGFEADERQKKLDQLLTYELPALLQTVTILDIKDIKPDEEKDVVAKAIVDFLISPTGKTIAEVEKENPVKEDEEEDGEDEEVDDEEESEEEQEVKPKGSPRKRAGEKGGKGGRPKRATASRVWTNDYGSSEEEEVEEVKPKVGRKKKNESDSGSDYNPNISDDSEADRRKSARNPVKKPTRGGRRKNVSESDEESPSDEDFSEEELPKKKKPAGRGAPPKRGGAKRGRKRKQETESEEESEEEDEEEEAVDSDDSEKAKKSRKPAPKSTPQKNSKGRPKRAAPPPKKKKKDESDDESDGDEPEESEDDEPLKKPPKKSAAEKSAPVGEGAKDGPTDDDIKTLLKDILAEANLEEITMKTVCKKVYAHYPGHDLTQKKDFIKQTVKSLIAA